MKELLVLIFIFVAIELLVGWLCDRYKRVTKNDIIKSFLKDGFSIEKNRVYLYDHCSGYKILDLNKPYIQEDVYVFESEDFEEALKWFSELTDANRPC